MHKILTKCVLCETQMLENQTPIVMEKNQDNKKYQITERFLIALDYLIDSGRIKTIADFERITGFRSQRITGMRSFVNSENNTKSYYAHTDHIAVLHEEFGVSLEYLISGIKPIIADTKSDSTYDDRAVYESKQIALIKEELALLKEKVEFLKERMNLNKGS